MYRSKFNVLWTFGWRRKDYYLQKKNGKWVVLKTFDQWVS